MTKGNDGSGNIAARDEWQTPQWLFNELNRQYNFKFDCCATYLNRKCKDYSDNFLYFKAICLSELRKCCWMNPPFSKSLKMFEHFFKVVFKGVTIYRSDNLETKLWQDIIMKNATWIFIFNYRVNYEGEEGKGARFPSALIGYNVEPPINLNGTILIIKKTAVGGLNEKPD